MLLPALVLTVAPAGRDGQACREAVHVDCREQVLDASLRAGDPVRLGREVDVILSSPRLRLSLCWWGEEWQDEGLVKRASAADFVNVGGLLTEGEVSRDGRGRTVEEAVPEGAARSAEADSTVRPRPKFFPPSSDLGLTRPSPFPRGTRRASCSRAFRAACGCCISRSRASPPQSPRPSCGSSSRGNIRP